MTLDPKKILAGATAGLVTAVLIDLNAWSKTEKGTKFDWELAGKRWLGGAVTGIAAAAGIGALP